MEQELADAAAYAYIYVFSTPALHGYDTCVLYTCTYNIRCNCGLWSLK